MDKLYARYIDMMPEYMYPGAIDHYAEGDIVAYAYGLQRNAVYVVQGHEGRLAKVDCTNRPVFEAETILEKGSLAEKLCSPFDAAGRAVSRLIDPNALALWLPEVGDEIFINNKPAVICGRQNKNMAGGGEIDVIKEFKKPLPPPGPNTYPSWRREFLFSRVTGGRPPVLQDASERSCWGFKMYIKVLHTPGLIYGESMGGAQEQYSFDPDAATIYELESREDCYKRVTPIFGRDKVDFEFRDGKVGLFRQHCGCRGICSFKCIKGGDGLEEGKHYGCDSISAARSIKIPIWDDKIEAYRAYRLDRFELPAMLREG